MKLPEFNLVFSTHILSFYARVNFLKFSRMGRVGSAEGTARIGAVIGSKTLVNH